MLGDYLLILHRLFVTMGKDKLRKWVENKTFDHVFEPNLQDAVNGVDGEMKGNGVRFLKTTIPSHLS